MKGKQNGFTFAVYLFRNVKIANYTNLLAVKAHTPNPPVLLKV